MCWCRSCQRIAAGSATVNILFPENAIKYEGEITTIARIGDSGNKVERGFCPKCGSHIYARMVEPDGKLMAVRAGALDDAELMAPETVIWASSAPNWARFAEEIPVYSKGPESRLLPRGR